MNAVADKPIGHHEIVDHIEAAIVQLPRCAVETIHHFSPGVYAREIRVKAGSVITGKIHRTRHLNIVSAGRLRVLSDGGTVQEITAPFTFQSEPGTRRAAIVLEDAVWTTIHPTDLDGNFATPAQREDAIAALELKLVEDRNNPLIQGKEQPCLSSQ